MVRRLRNVLNIASKIFVVSAVLIVVVNLFLYFLTKNSLKSTFDPVKENRKQIYATINDPSLQKTKRDKQVLSVYRASICLFIGEACTNNPSDGDKYFNGSVFGGIAKLIAFPYANPPASGIYWAYSGLQGAGFVPKSYAAEGIGFSALKPLSGLWQMFRNVSYMLVVLILLVVGFMIMFRVKINPQTMVTLENSLPRIVITLLLITFSFAIGGFLIDLMYVVTGLAVSIVSNNGVFSLGTNLQRDLITSGGITKLFDMIFWNENTLRTGGAIYSLMPTFINVVVRTLTAGIWLFLFNKINPLKQLLNGDPCNVAGFEVGALACSIAAWLIIPSLLFLFSPILLSIFILVTTGLLVFFRIFFLLFATYLRILFSIMFSPIILLGNALPGRNMFMRWIKGLVADLLVFPIVIVLVAISTIIVNIPRGRGDFWSPPFLYTVDPTAFNILVGIGLMFMIPDIIKNIRGLFGIKESPIKFGLGTLFAGAAAAGTGATGVLDKFLERSYRISTLPPKWREKIENTRLGEWLGLKR